MMKLKDMWEKRKSIWNFLKNPLVTAILGIIFGLLVSTQLHTANVNFHHYLPYGDWSDFSLEINRVSSTYNDKYNFTFDVLISNRWIETKTAHIKIKVDSSNDKIKCVFDGKSCDEIYKTIPPNVEEKVVITPNLNIGDFSPSDIPSDGFNLCVDVIDDQNNKHNIRTCKKINILDR